MFTFRPKSLDKAVQAFSLTSVVCDSPSAVSPNAPTAVETIETLLWRITTICRANRHDNNQYELLWHLLVGLNTLSSFIITVREDLKQQMNQCATYYVIQAVWHDLQEQAYVYSNHKVSFISEHLSVLWRCVIILGCVVSVFGLVGGAGAALSSVLSLHRPIKNKKTNIIIYYLIIIYHRFTLTITPVSSVLGFH